MLVIYGAEQYGMVTDSSCCHAAQQGVYAAAAAIDGLHVGALVMVARQAGVCAWPCWSICVQRVRGLAGSGVYCLARAASVLLQSCR